MQATLAEARREDLAQRVLRTLADHRWFVALVAAYGLAGWAVVQAAGVPERLTLFQYNGVMPFMTLLCVIAFTLGYPIYVMVWVRPQQLTRYLLEQARTRWLTPERLVSGAVIFILLPPVVSVYSSLKTLIPLMQPYGWDITFVAWDRALHGGVDPWRLLQPLLGYPIATSLVNFFYNLWFFVLYGILFWQAFSLSDDRLRRQFFTSFVLLWALLGGVLATLWSSAGPVYFGRVTGLSDPFLPLMDYLRAVNQVAPVWALEIQEQLWQDYSGAGGMVGGGISAMPSLHVATATLFALLGFRVHRWVGWIFTAYAGIILVGSVHLAWHYAVDGYVSIVLTCLIWFVVGRWIGRGPST